MEIQLSRLLLSCDLTKFKCTADSADSTNPILRSILGGYAVTNDLRLRILRAREALRLWQPLTLSNIRTGMGLRK